MHTPLNAEITRLYRLDSESDSQPLELVSAGGLTRSMVLEFRRKPGQAVPHHWDNLCRMASYLQQQLDLPAPAVSISGQNSYQLWLSLSHAVPVEQAENFLLQLCASYFPDVLADELDWLPQHGGQHARTSVECPPRLQNNGLWSAFIHPGMGAAFEDEAGLEVEPPAAGQAAFLESLHCISDSQWTHACALLQSQQGVTAPAAVHASAAGKTGAAAHASPASSGNDSLLLKDATLEDIIHHLHERNIEPTFRHLHPKR
ncbi:hypothetical protein [Duganella qianjiadongensis]|uniref:Uncharacterized protein n=1 Tax=Duganella qianjiadongensis TaxID=2692176 RepID=A0ABW9VK74_9BURK|nr:hypothetical protein [Duganella qianjiadongensis]MYM40003.1 hypothetical protein [Duganella qianjiadongensis]